jgi:hypothetical protein
MALIEPRGRPYVACPKCKANVVWPTGFSADEKRLLANVTRSSVFEGAQLAHRKFGLDLREAKALSFHITRDRGKCHRCAKPVSGDVSVCPNCRSANLDW